MGSVTVPLNSEKSRLYYNSRDPWLSGSSRNFHSRKSISITLHLRELTVTTSIRKIPDSRGHASAFRDSKGLGIEDSRVIRSNTLLHRLEEASSFNPWESISSPIDSRDFRLSLILMIFDSRGPILTVATTLGSRSQYRRPPISITPSSRTFDPGNSGNQI